MTSFFFSPHKDFIKHTLATADDSVTAKHEILSAGTEVTLLDCGVLRFEPPTAATVSLVISCAVHGNETAPIEIINQLVNNLLEEDAKCRQRVLIILGNPWAMQANQRFIDLNMNRLFSGDWQQQDVTLKEVKRAAKLEAYVANFFAEEPVTVTERLHYDCHTAIRDSARERFAVYPYVAGRSLPASQQQFLAAAEIDTVLLQQRPGNTFAAFTSSRQNAQSFTLELGKVRPFGENDLTRLRPIDEALRQLIAGEVLTEANRPTPECFTVCHDVIKTSDNWQFFIADDVANFTEFAPGFVVWRDGDKHYQVTQQSQFIVFPNPHVPVGQRAGLMLKKQP